MHSHSLAKDTLIQYLREHIQPGRQLAKANLIEQVLARHPQVGTGAVEKALVELIREGYLSDDYQAISRVDGENSPPSS